jgi:hypothetical protein
LCDIRDPRMAFCLQPDLPVRRGMILAVNPTANLYRVEVSGWDHDKAFFVENSELEWSEDGKQVTLSRTLNHGAVVFLRLLQPMSSDRSNPVAYEAELLSSTTRGPQQFRLRPVCSRPNRHSEPLSK